MKNCAKIHNDKSCKFTEDKILMRRNNELLPKDLKDICNPNQFKFELTKEND